MKQLQLFLNIERSSVALAFEIGKDNDISFDDNKYVFSSISYNEIPVENLIEKSSRLLLVGTSTSGKTSPLQVILQYFANLEEEVQFSACEVDSDNNYVDLLKETQFPKRIGLYSLEGYLTKDKLDNGVILKLLKEKDVAATNCHWQYSRSFTVMNIYYGPRVITIGDVTGEEQFFTAAARFFVYFKIPPSSSIFSTALDTEDSHDVADSLILHRASASRISLVMHLDQSTDVSSVRFLLTSLTQIVETFSTHKIQLDRSKVSSSVLSVLGGPEPKLCSDIAGKRLSSCQSKIQAKRSIDVGLEGPRMKFLRTPSERVMNLGCTTSHLAHYSAGIKTLQNEVIDLNNRLAESEALNRDLRNASGDFKHQEHFWHDCDSFTVTSSGCGSREKKADIQGNCIEDFEAGPVQLTSETSTVDHEPLKATQPKTAAGEVAKKKKCSAGLNDHVAHALEPKTP